MQTSNECTIEALLAHPALSFGGEAHDIADLVLVGLLTGEWQALEFQVAVGLGLEAEWTEELSADELAPAVAAFRYERRLIAAAELRAWLSERSLCLDDLEGVLWRGLLRRRLDGVPSSPPTEAQVAAVIRAEALVAGTLAQGTEELRAWHAACDAVVEMQDGRAPNSRPAATPTQVAAAVAAALADTASGLPELGPAELRRRAERLVALTAGYERFRDSAVAEDAVDARLAERRLEWTVVTGSELSFALEGAALETRLRVVHDGRTLAQVAESLGLDPVRRELELGTAPAELGAELLVARERDLVGPWSERERWRVLELDGRHEPEPTNARIRARAREELVSELVERFSAGKAAILAAL